MVRLKSRYVLFEILYPPVDADDSYDALCLRSSKDIQLRYRQMSSPVITHKSIMQELRKVLQTNFGDYGMAQATAILQVKYFSNKTSTGILRCSREHYQLVVMALMLMKRIDTITDIIVNPVKVSGTIKKIERYAIRRNQQLMTLLESSDPLSEFANVSDDDDTRDQG
ncbi:AaceriADR362Cp [[Ashbya] aceris (nom. inval.)]|nr:AaceriADR362Cp [[Ashbya] aceris (nom. inval.)]